MRLASRLRAHVLKSPVYILLSKASTSAAVRSLSGAGTIMKQQQQQPLHRAGAVAGRSGILDWAMLIKRRLAAACRPRSLARIFGAVLVALLLIIIITKGYTSRRRSVCKCAKFAYSQCQPYDGNCGPGVKKAFCQQRKCQPRRKLVRCTTPCGGGGDAQQLGYAAACAYSVRRQSRWSRCLNDTKHKSRILFLQTGSPSDCPATKTERRPCQSEPRKSVKKTCTYESRGSWTACNRDRNEIVNVRRLVDVASPGDCPMELKTAMRCLKRDGSLRCIYSKWSKWSQCVSGTREKLRSLIQGIDCGEVTRVVQTCTPGKRLTDGGSLVT